MGLVAFKLGDIPLAVRLRGKDVALRREDSSIERLKIGLAAERPSQKVYWISAAAWQAVSRNTGST